MSFAFKLLGLVLACYVVRALARGEIYAKSGVWGRVFRRDEEAWGYWPAVAAYSALSLALLFVF